jgi:hypothetical protein
VRTLLTEGREEGQTVRFLLTDAPERFYLPDGGRPRAGISGFEKILSSPY